MELAAITGTIVGQPKIVENPVDIESAGRFARIIVAFDCEGKHEGTCKLVAYRRLSPQYPSVAVQDGDEVSLMGPMYSTEWGGTAVEAETMSLVSAGVTA